MKILIKYYGKDYTKIDNQIKECDFIPHIDELPLEIKNELEKDDVRKDILKKFLDKVSQEKSFGNRSIDSLSPDDYEVLFSNKIYNSVNDMFQGKVGIVRDNINYIFDNITDEENRNCIIEVQLQINTRFDDDPKHPFFLTALMLNDDLNLVDANIPSDDYDNIFDFMFVMLFKKYLLEANLKGIFKTYVHFEANDDRLKGPIDISRHIKLNIGQDNGKIAYSYRENTTNNYLNKLIIYTYKYLLKNHHDMMVQCFNENCTDIINDIVGSIDMYEYSANVLISKNKNPITHPLFFEYEMLRKVCLRIIRNEGNNLFDIESGNNVQGFLADIPNLWELFLKNYFDSYNLNPCYQDVNHIISINDGDEKEFKIEARPDFVFYNNDGTANIILDAKFVEGFENLYYKYKLSNSRMNDYNKCIRDMNMLNIHKSGVLFPVKHDVGVDVCERNFIEHSISKKNTEDRFYTFGFKVPMYSENISYIEYKKLLDDSMKKTLDEIIKIIKDDQ